MAFHYCRKDSRKQYIDPQLTLPQLYELYLAWLKEKSNAAPGDKDVEVSVSERCYREMFENYFNISPLHPAKDQCLICAGQSQWERKRSQSPRENET